MDWKREIVQLHEFFEGWLRGSNEPDTFETGMATLAETFTHVDPHGGKHTRTELFGILRPSHGSRPHIRIVVDQFEELVRTPGVTVARYVEHHQHPTHRTERISTVAFHPNAAMRNGVSWITVHETWKTPPPSPSA